MIRKRRIGGTINDVLQYSTEVYEDKPAISLKKMSELEGRFGYNWQRGCDVLEGPCSCGAWHSMDWKKCRERVFSLYSSLLNLFDEKADERNANSLGSDAIVSLTIHQNQPYIEVLVNPQLKQENQKRIEAIIKEHSREQNFTVQEEKDEEGSFYLIEPDYRHAKRLFGFIV